jgi:hypothetical protein
MKFLNYPRQTPLSQPILSQPWLNLVVDAIMGVVKFRTREDGIVELDLERGARRGLTNVVTEKVGENSKYGIEVTIHWWEWEDEPSWYLEPFVRTNIGRGTREHRVGDSALRIGKGHGEADGDKHFLGIRGFNQEVFEKLQTRISRLEGVE